MHIAQKFEYLLEVYRHPDGHEWTGAELERATGSVVPRSYVTNLRKGRIESPGYEKLRAIAKAMGFAPEVWFEEDLGVGEGCLMNCRGAASRAGWSTSSLVSGTRRLASPTRTPTWPG